MKNIKGLHTLRALGVIGVLFYHAFPNHIRGGFFGVLIFFVLSGYLKGLSVHKDISFFQYYKKRILRLYPTLIIVLLSSVGLLALIDKYKMINTPQELLSIVLGYNNFWQIKMNSSYFTNLTNTSPFTHLWYLSILFQFELVWPFFQRLYLFLCKNYNEKNVLSILLIITLLSFLILPCFFLFSKEVNYTNLYYNTFTRFFSILAGVFLGLLHSRGKRKKRSLSSFVMRIYYFLFILLTLLFYLFAKGTDTWVYLVGMQGYTILICIMIHFFYTKPKAFTKLVDDKISKYLSTYSYEIYLWQYPILFLTSILFKNATSIPKLFPIIITILLSIWLKSFVLFLSNHKRINIV